MTTPTAIVVPVNSAPQQITAAVKRMKDLALDRDAAMTRVRMVREGRFSDVWPDMFSQKLPTSIVANFVDVACRDVASTLAPLPSLACASGAMKSESDKRRAATKNRIGAYYWKCSDLEYQFKYSADQYLSYGFIAGRVEPNYDESTPEIRMIDPQGCYYEQDRRGWTTRFHREWKQDKHELAALFPEYASRIIDRDIYGVSSGPNELNVVHYTDRSVDMIYLPDRQNLIVASVMHGMPWCPVQIDERPGLTHNPRGQYDDVLWVQLAQSVMAALTLEAAEKAVQAPIALPDDVTEINIGPDAVIVSNSPEKIGRVALQVPQSAFALTEQLGESMREGAGYPGTRLGQPGQANVTGRGISALEGGFDSQIKLGQDVLGRLLRRVTAMCFEMDTLLWPNKAKKINGLLSGESFSLTYIPSRDIGDNFTCDISYGFAAGTNPQAAAVTMLQLRGDGIITRDTFRRNLPIDIDPDHEQRGMDVQMIDDALKEGIAAALQASGQMIAQGQMAEAMLFFKMAAKVIEGRRNGEDLSALVTSALEEAQQEQQEEQAEQAQQQQAGPPGAPPGAAGPGGEPLSGVGPDGLSQGVAPGQAGLPPGGRPGVTDLTAAFSGGGQPRLSASVRRRIPTG